MTVHLESKVEFDECCQKISSLAPAELDRNCRRVGLALILAGALCFKFSIYDSIMSTINGVASAPLLMVILASGMCLSSGLMLLFGGKTIPQSFRVNGRSGKFGVAAWIVSTVVVLSGLSLGLFLQLGSDACVRADFQHLDLD